MADNNSSQDIATTESVRSRDQSMDVKAQGQMSSVMDDEENEQNMDQIMKVNQKPSHADEHMLPVHFLPEGKKCYDWINEDIEKDAEKKQKESKEKSSTVNTMTYHNCQIDSTAVDTGRKQVVRNLLNAAENGDLANLTNILRTNPLYVNDKDGDGYTALHRACYSGHENIVSYLLGHGGSVHSQTNDGWQPLHCAARWNQLEICKILLEKKADVNARTKGKQTPLHFASLTSDSQQILEMFLLHPAIDAAVTNDAGDTPRDIAYRNGLQYQLFDLVDESLKI